MKIGRFPGVKYRTSNDAMPPMPTRIRSFIAVACLSLGTSHADFFPRWENVGPTGGKFNAIAADPSQARPVVDVDAEGIVGETSAGGRLWQTPAAPSCFDRGTE